MNLYAKQAHRATCLLSPESASKYDSATMSSVIGDLMNEKNGGVELKISDRVRRVDGQGTNGLVKTIRHDSLASASIRDEKGLLIGVQWDNGTYSYLTPESLRLADA